MARDEVTRFLRAHGAGDIEHPGGTLLEHLRRVAGTLAAWGADEDVQLAGQCHATYGTDGFGTALLEVARRAELRQLIGARAEHLVYLYGSLDRAATYPRLGDATVVVRDRFTGQEHAPSEEDIRAIVEITAANELDVVEQNAELAGKYGPGLRRLFERARDRLSEPARRAWLSRFTT
jgi:hypothetical protein